MHHSSALPSLSFPTRPGSPTLTDSCSEGSLIDHAPRCLIDILPDDVLLSIFCLRLEGYYYISKRSDIKAWQTLIHVCRRWRTIVFGSPRRLNLQLLCSAKTPARDALDVWPALPLVVHCNNSDDPIEHVDNIVALVAVLERCNRVYQIHLECISSPDLEKVSSAMQEPFPELSYLWLTSNQDMVPVFPASFLGGSTPPLQYLHFRGIPFPGLPEVLLSATHLDELELHDIPHSGYFSPEEMATALSTLTSLRSLVLHFQSPLSCPGASRGLPPRTRWILPVLTSFSFKGVSEYLDDLVARIDTLRLDSLAITFFNQILFDTPQLIQFISRTPTFQALKEARVAFNSNTASVKLSRLKMTIVCEDLDWQVSSLEQVCNWCLPPLIMLEDLYISKHLYRRDDIENAMWLELLRPFSKAKSLHLSKKIASLVVPSLQELVGGRTTETLPILEKIFLEELEPSGPVWEGIGQFLAARQATGHPVAVSAETRVLPASYGDIAEYEIFRQQLAIKYPHYGHALWAPSPRNPDSPVQIGDVGFIRQGKFHRLFNSLLPADDPSHEFGVPEYHKPLVPNVSDHIVVGSLGSDNYCSAGVSVESDPGHPSSDPDDFQWVSFQYQRTREAAVLSLPVAARRKDTLARDDFCRWIVQHIDSWFAFARSLGVGIEEMEEIVLVTGCDLTRSWTNIVFPGDQVDAQVSFGVNVEGPGTSINFQSSPELVRGAVISQGPEGTNLPENQCVFIRGFRVRRTFRWLPRRLAAAAGPSPDSYDRNPCSEGVSIPATEYRDPLHLLMDYIVEEARDCEMVLVHDDDLAMIGDPFRRPNIQIHRFCAKDLAPIDGGSNVDMSLVKVATLPMTAENWRRSPLVPTIREDTTKCETSLLDHGDSAPSTPPDLAASAFCRTNWKKLDKVNSLLTHVPKGPVMGFEGVWS